ncbi:MAG: hypothetical protein ACRDU4_18505, partial [Mycobacterium sp.]
LTVITMGHTPEEIAMELTSRPWITAVVALAGASVIAVTPVAPPLPRVDAPSVQLTEGFLETWQDVLSTASANATSIARDSVGRFVRRHLIPTVE